jgi:hypothetical protein
MTQHDAVFPITTRDSFLLSVNLQFTSCNVITSWGGA